MATSCSRRTRRLPGIAATLLVLAAALSFAAAALAQPVEGRERRRFRAGTRAFDLTADFITYERAGELYVARGDVQIAQDGRLLSADWAAFSNQTRKGMAIGNVVAREGEDIIHARAMRFQVDEQVGLVLGGRVESATHEFRLNGEEIERRGANQYRLRDASFTTCQCPEGERDPWVVSSEELDVEIGGYATARNSTIDILGVPMFWLPWLVYPVKSERETGLLFPTIRTSSRTGADIGLPFFWAAGDPLNVTIAPHYLTKRGFKPELSLEYVIGERSWGEAYGTFLWNDDRVDQNDPLDPNDSPSTPFSNDRWAIDLRHDQQDLPGQWRTKIDATVLSDNLFPFDFPEYATLRNDRHIDSLAFVENRFGARDQLGVSAEVRFADDMQSPDNLDRDRTWLQRAPDVRASLLPSGVFGSHVFWALDARYTHFTSLDRVSQAYPGVSLGPGGSFLDTGLDGLPTGFEVNLTTGDPSLADESGDDFDALLNPLGREGDGTFQEGELLADRGDRVVISPRLYTPVRLGDVVEILPEVGYYGTFYHSQQRGNEARHLITGQLDARARLRRTIPLPRTTRRAIHLIEPRIGFAWVERVGSGSQADNPLFVPRSEILQARLRALEPISLTRDPADRIDEVEALHVSLGSRLYVGVDEESAPPRLLADATLTAWWDFAGDAVRNIFLDGAVFPAKRWRSRFDLGLDLDETRVDEGLLEMGYADERGNDLAFGYRFLRDLPKFFEGFRYDPRFDEFSVNFEEINQFDLYGRWTLLRGFAVTYRVQYSIEGSFSLRHQFGVEYVSRCRCWAIRLEGEDERSRGFEVGISYRILGVGDDLIRPFSSRRLRGQDSIITR